MWVRVGLFVAAFVAAADARAQGFDPSFAVELHPGPLVAPTNIVGMGGAFVSIAEGAGAQLINPASVSNRFGHNGDVYFDWDWALDWLNVGVSDNIDFENNGQRSQVADRLTIFTGALNFNFGRFGIGVHVSSQTLAFGLPSEAFALPDTTYSAGLFALSGGYVLMDGQLVFGVQLLGASATVRARDDLQPDQPVDLLKMAGAGWAVGAVARPVHQPYRFGFSFRSQTNLNPETEGVTPGRVIAPRAVVMPWEFIVGMSYSLGSRSLNRTTSFGDDEDETESTPREEPRDYITIAADVVVTGQTDRASGFEAWVDDKVQVAGENTTVGVRVGIESEFWPDRMRGRAGFYYEPSRFELGGGRTHITAGFDFHLGKVIWDWRAGAAIDASFRYMNFMLAGGFWY